MYSCQTRFFTNLKEGSQRSNQAWSVTGVEAGVYCSPCRWMEWTHSLHTINRSVRDLMALFLPRVPREGSGKPLLVCAGSHTHTQSHNVHYNVVMCCLHHTSFNMLLSLYQKCWCVCMNRSSLSTLWMSIMILLLWRKPNCFHPKSVFCAQEEMCFMFPTAATQEREKELWGRQRKQHHLRPLT